MAKALLISKENIVKGAVKLVNKEGWNNLNARSLAKQLGISTKPLYRIYNNMEEIKTDVLAEIYRQYDEFINSKIDSKKALLTLCIAYVEFANDYKNLFTSLFLSDNLKILVYLFFDAELSIDVTFKNFIFPMFSFLCSTIFIFSSEELFTFTVVGDE